MSGVIILIAVVCAIGLGIGLWRVARSGSIRNPAKLTSKDFQIISWAGHNIPGIESRKPRTWGNARSGFTRAAIFVNRDGLCLLTGRTIADCDCPKCKRIK
jgi:hypothetical protein